ncbi:helix-turn-helix domain-containing protein [Desulfitispora alkaliphila]|uniref:helix-turn-helix domain-containing protein n=1 Tax=Desulfitispora alkaliphila TaxID=622674 RepID=UPI003D1DDF29
MIGLEKVQHKERGSLKKSKRWNMYLRIQELKHLGLNVSQIARHTGISRNTIYKYIDMSPDEFST